ncbi:MULTISPECIES: helix-turn-helix domain-containing protein [Paraburkholderia]|uniref:helix-turn-helix domain-containing protein n=1 Tax=Paraburkholderia TaxID=1822464 RepID=UPI00224D6154|nr:MULTISPECIES: helix-turn-helix domain-containing protein [Paraburkholderia]MCX4161384.1 helix-turn-helix domain-containing protein [Paraburkholderia megapolitana]MDN7156880.1 helix-turn-helix domain-containing protein [Paraburkholderia sp. CHISQ3]MDQ6493925.1 helix-turn-helix domain-containing protein [Paraburkholderia megapolitana]
MPDCSPLDVRRFSTRDVPADERFDAWVASSISCDYVAAYQSDIPFDVRCEHVLIGPLVLASRTWRHPNPSVSYEARRTAARLRADQRDFLSFSLQLDGSVALRSDAFACIKPAGELYVLDFGRAFERVIMPSTEISLSVPRDLLPAGAEPWHGRSLTRGMASLFGHYLSHLYQTLPRLTTRDIPNVTKATMHLLTATLQPGRDAQVAAQVPVQNVLKDRVQRYIDAHLLQPDLTADRICRDVGISRATLYRLFDHTDGIMREIRHRRLYRVHQVLSTPRRPRERIRDVALRHGFTDEKYFIRIFKAQFGYTPRDTFERRQHRDETDDPLSVQNKAREST